MARIGFIGLGNMGLPMAANLVKAGHAVTGFDMVASSLSKFATVGGSAAQSNASAVADAEVIITMLPAGREVREVYLSADGVLARSAPGALLVDSSTIDVETARAVASAAEAKGFAMLDAPVSGGVTGAQGATLTFMVGGPADAFARAKPLLDAMGKTIVHAGAAGSGQAAKICNNMMLAISMIGVSEGFLLADRLGLDRQKLFDIASKSSGQSWAMTTYCPVPGLVPTSPANRDYQAGFTAAMMLKDLRLAQEAARAAGATTPLGAEAAALFGLYVAHGQGGLDFSGIINFLRGK
jgi:3-hydroxyisobutyrate dehydrogenase